MAVVKSTRLPGERETQINTLPVGLLSFMGLKQFGRSPDHLTDRVAGVFDLSEFYRSSQLTVRTNSLGPFAPANNGFFATGVSTTVPIGEAWMLIGFGAVVNGVAAGEVVELAPGIGFPNGTPGSFDQQLLSPQQTFTGTAVVTSPIIGIDPAARGQILTGGQALGFHLSKMGAAITLVHTQVIIRLSV